jgi:hypothetical protein
MPNIQDVLKEMEFLTSNQYRDVTAAFTLNGDFAFASSASEAAGVVESGGDPISIFGWKNDVLRCRAVPEFRSAGKQVEMLYQHKIHLIERQNGTNSMRLVPSSIN